MANRVEADRGTSWLSVIFGWLTALGAGLILSGIVGAIVGAILGGSASPSSSATESGTAGLLGLLLTLLLAFIIGGYVAGRLASRSELKQGQLGIAVQLTANTFLILLGGVALAAAIAFGVGGRDVASDILQRAYGRSGEVTPSGGSSSGGGDDRPTVRRLS